jgi:hypothetical protein
MDTDTKPTKPTEVKQAQVILYFCLLVSEAQFVLRIPKLAVEHDIPIVSVVIGVCLVLAFWGGLIYMIGKRKNWARILYLALFVLFLGRKISLCIASSNWTFSAGSSGLYFFEILALVMLFQSDVSDWFRGGRHPEAVDNKVEVVPAQSATERLPEVPGTHNEPLFVFKYQRYKQSIFIVMGAILVLISVVGTIIIIEENGILGFWQIVYVFVNFILLFIFIEFLLFAEIRLYEDRVEKTWSILGSVQVLLEDARIAGNRYGWARPKCICNRTMGAFKARFRGVWYQEGLMDRQDISKFNALLADLSGRSVKDFERASFSINPLIERSDKDGQ